MIDEEKLNYIGSVVLGLNDALVELTGALAGFTFAFQNTQLIAVTGLITGISASLSMSSSGYLSMLQETGERDRALKSAFYTGLAYVLTVVVLITPFLLLANPFVSLVVSLVAAVMIIFILITIFSVVQRHPLQAPLPGNGLHQPRRLRLLFPDRHFGQDRVRDRGVREARAWWD